METTMSTPIRFDKLRFVKKLQGVDANSPDFPEKLAEAVDEALEQSQSPLVTKADLKELKSELMLEMSQLRTELTSSMYKMAGLILAGAGVLMSVMKFIN